MISISTRNTPIFPPIFLIKKGKESLERSVIMLHPVSGVRLDLIISSSSVAYFTFLRWYFRVIDIQIFSASYTGLRKCINRASDLPRRAAERRGRKMCAWRSGKALKIHCLFLNGLAYSLSSFLLYPTKTLDWNNLFNDRALKISQHFLDVEDYIFSLFLYT